MGAERPAPRGVLIGGKGKRKIVPTLRNGKRRTPGGSFTIHDEGRRGASCVPSAKILITNIRSEKKALCSDHETRGKAPREGLASPFSRERRGRVNSSSKRTDVSEGGGKIADPLSLPPRKIRLPSSFTRTGKKGGPVVRSGDSDLETWRKEVTVGHIAAIVPPNGHGKKEPSPRR